MENTQVAVVDSAALNESRALSGGSQYGNVPYIPVIKINQVAEEKTIDVEGVPTKVKLPIHVGFNITDGQKDAEGKYIVEYFGEKLRGVILHERYKIKSKWKVEPAFYSKEFTNFFDPITIYTNREMVAQGTYKKLKEIYQTAEMDSTGKHKKMFDLILVLYIWMPDVDKIIKFEYKMSGQNKWFDYKASFNKDSDHYTAYITDFVLHLEKSGTNDFYAADYVCAEPVNLQDVIKKQKELKVFLDLKDNIGKVDTSVQTDGYEEPVIQIENIESKTDFDYTYKEEPNKEISIDDIPF